MINKFYKWLFNFVLRKITGDTGYRCGNRYGKVFHYYNWEVTVIYRDTTKEDGYSREELYRMLKLIRKEEIRQQWKIPEPEQGELK